MKRKGFTLVELLVVIAIIALLMGILMPALARVRQLAFRMTCGTNLSGIGKAMLIYSNDYEDELPKAGGRTNTWVAELPNPGWMAPDHATAFKISNNAGQVTPSSSFYLLVKYSDVTPKQFVCKGETDTTEFKLTDYTAALGSNSAFQLIDAWDFGTTANGGVAPDKHCSYSYHWPFNEYALTTSSDSSMAIAADRNPWLTAARVGSNANPDLTWDKFIPDDDQFSGQSGQGGNSETAKVSNSDAHQLDGQNVLFVDSHVKFENRAFCGLEEDNIYTIGNDTNYAKHSKGNPPTYLKTSPGPQSRQDSVLVQNDSGLKSGTTR